ncbi:MAG TPA: cyclopropane-fatty-acyl-phospholipid synthase family protein [Bauldia sp.]|nr:cyclopropane-fatty-acyl-phospholipid synthase family protein [Bauldia sp.]
MNRLLKAFLERTVKTGALEVVDPEGKVHRFGDGGPAQVRVRFASKAVERAILLHAQLKLGEAFMDGGFTVESGSIYDFLALIISNDTNARPSPVARAISRFRHLTRHLRTLNTLTRARRNVAQHYDLDRRLYSLFLDEDLQYSCAYFETPGMSLDAAQAAKRRHLGGKLLLKPGMRVLDIGCGYGGLALYLAETFGVEVTGVTLSTEQHAVATERAAERGLSGKVRFLLEDYRQVAGTYDRIVSVGMFEHVGRPSHRRFFERCYELLTPDGLLVLHSVVRLFGPMQTNAWVEKYIFPGGASPALSDVAPVIEKSGFVLSDIEFLRLHYAETLRAWRERFMANREAARNLYDERFCRMWEFYLAGFEAAFRFDDLAVFQLQLGKKLDTVPLTRKYLYS